MIDCCRRTPVSFPLLQLQQQQLVRIPLLALGLAIWRAVAFCACPHGCLLLLEAAAVSEAPLPLLPRSCCCSHADRPQQQTAYHQPLTAASARPKGFFFSSLQSLACCVRQLNATPTNTNSKTDNTSNTNNKTTSSSSSKTCNRNKAAALAAAAAAARSTAAPATAAAAAAATVEEQQQQERLLLLVYVPRSPRGFSACCLPPEASTPTVCTRAKSQSAFGRLEPQQQNRRSSLALLRWCTYTPTISQLLPLCRCARRQRAKGPGKGASPQQQQQQQQQLQQQQRQQQKQRRQEQRPLASQPAAAAAGAAAAAIAAKAARKRRTSHCSNDVRQPHRV
ncbi:hypothetical protein Efla_003127 [Eimeria flavescens]